MRDFELEGHIFQANVNSWIGATFILVFGLGAGLLIWHVAFGENPIANALVSQVQY